MVHLFRYHTCILKKAQDPLSEINLLGLLQSFECGWWDIFWICGFVFNTRQYKWNCFQFVSSRIGSSYLLHLSRSCTLQTPLTPRNFLLSTTLDKLKGKLHSGAQQTIIAEIQTRFQRLVRSIPWSLLCCCVTVDHLLHRDGEGRTLVPAIGVRRVTQQEQSWVRVRQWQPSCESPVQALQPKAENESFSPSKAFGRDCFVVFYRALFINSPTCSLPFDIFFVLFCAPHHHPLPLLTGNSVQHHNTIIFPLLINVDLIARVVYMLIF